MLALPWLYLALLSIGYVLALAYGQLGVLALVSIALLLIAGYAVRQQRTPWARNLGHGLFIVLALSLAMHWLPGFYNGRGIDPQRVGAGADRHRRSGWRRVAGGDQLGAEMAGTGLAVGAQ